MNLKKKALALALAVCLPLLYMILQVVFSLVGVVAVSSAWAMDNTTPLLLISALALLLLLTLAFRLSGNRLAAVSGFSVHAPSDACLLAALAGIAGNTLCAFVLPLVPFPEVWLLEYEELISSLTASSPVVQWLTIGLVVPIVEEILFRGLMIPTLERAFSPKTTLCLQALLFALFHWDKVQFLYVLAMAFLLGLAFQWSRSLRVPLVMHIAFNCFSLAVTLPLEQFPLNLYLASLCLLLCLTLALMRSLRGRFPREP